MTTIRRELEDVGVWDEDPVIRWCVRIALGCYAFAALATVGAILGIVS